MQNTSRRTSNIGRKTTNFMNRFYALFKFIYSFRVWSKKQWLIEIFGQRSCVQSRIGKIFIKDIICWFYIFNFFLETVFQMKKGKLSHGLNLFVMMLFWAKFNSQLNNDFSFFQILFGLLNRNHAHRTMQIGWHWLHFKHWKSTGSSLNK
jgi:hypothetical protein